MGSVRDRHAASGGVVAEEASRESRDLAALFAPQLHDAVEQVGREVGREVGSERRLVRGARIFLVFFLSSRVLCLKVILYARGLA